MKKDLVRRLKLNQLRIIIAINNKGSLLKASDQLGLTQPALTRALHEVEGIIGGRLFTRSAKGVAPTALGELIIAAALRIQRELHELETEVALLVGSNDERLILGALPSAAAGLLPTAILELRRQSPNAQIRVIQGQTDELLTLLNTHAVDLVIGRLYANSRDDGLVREPLYEDRVALLARADHPLFAHPQPTLDQLQQYELAMTLRSTYSTAEIEALLEQLNLAPHPKFESNSPTLLREMLLSSNMITLMPQMMQAGDIQRGLIREVLPLPVENIRPCGLIFRPETRLNTCAERFMTILRQQILAMGLNPPSPT